MCTSGRGGSRSGGGAAAAAGAGRGLCHGEGSRAAGRGARAGTIVSSSGSDASTASSASSPKMSSRLGAAACRRMVYERRLTVVCDGGAASCGVSDATLVGAAAGAARSDGWRCGSPADTSSCGPLVLDGRTISNGVSSAARGVDGTGRAAETAGAVAATERGAATTTSSTISAISGPVWATTAAARGAICGRGARVLCTKPRR